MNTATVRSRSIGAYDRLDAHYFTSQGVAAAERVAVHEAAGRRTARVGDVATVWDPPRFARAYAAPAEPGVPYLRPYDVFDYLPSPSDRLSPTRNDGLERLIPTVGTILQTCSGRNLGPLAMVDATLAACAISHDMVRIEPADAETGYYLLAYLKTRTGQALLRRAMSGSVIDHITTGDVESVPLVFVDDETRNAVVADARGAVRAAGIARETLASVFAELERQIPAPTRQSPPRDGWEVSASTLTDRLDAAFHDPLVQAARAQVAHGGGVPLGSMARAALPVRYKRYYVESGHGRAILSGRQLLQLDPVNLRHVADRSFRRADEYEVATGTTLFGAVGRAEGRQGTPALVTPRRTGWLASNDVMRLQPLPGVAPAAVWLATALPQTRLQINALSFGSVIDHMNPWDVEAIIVPVLPSQLVERTSAAWERFAEAEVLMEAAVRRLEDAL